MDHTWDPQRYLTYADERGRPFAELVARGGVDAPRSGVHRGRRPGTTPPLLAPRWAGARVVGLDSSREMVEAARRDVGGVAGVDFERADLREWLEAGGEPVDVLVSNATLQWVPGHLDLLPALLERVGPGGWLAVQVPGNFDQPSHTLRTELAAQAAYAEHTRGAAVPSSHDPATYLDALARLGAQVDAWETTYLHVLTGEDPVFTWVSATGARPTLQALPDELRPGFEDELRRRLREAYPPGPAGVVLPFRRVFVVAHKPAHQSEGAR
ncbi:methyltransferase domain-containing protein [Nocardioides salarius]|uniref:methyltransferase domain-containing protein n=1 Tax=Nocardioides salarius TaxID=374513 RepID=UPI0030F74117